MRKYLMKMLMTTFCVLGVVMLWNAEDTTAATTSYIDKSQITVSNGELYWKKQKVGILNEQGQIVFYPLEDYEKNANALEVFVNNDKEKTVVLPEGTKLYLDEVLDIGSNTTIIAEGAEIIQKTGKGLLQHAIDGYKYDAIENVNIIGGYWYDESNEKKITMLRFIHGNNITLRNLKVDTNYGGHAVTLVACKKVLVENCELIAKNDATKYKESVEEALQMDMAAPNTAPDAAKVGKAYANGQTCKNITIKSCTIHGSRGISTNVSQREPKLLKNYHQNIKILNCNITATASEGIGLFNTVGFTVQNNTIQTTSKWRKGNHSDGLHIIMFKKYKKSKTFPNKIIGNTIYGDVHGINMWSMTSSKFGKTTAKNNTVYTRTGNKKESILVRCTKKAVTSKNKIKKWKL